MRNTRSATFLLGAILLIAIGWTSSTPLRAGAESNHAVIDSRIEPDGVSLHIRVPQYAIEMNDPGSQGYDRLSFEGQTGTLELPGAPQLPVIDLVFAAPPAGDITLEITQASTQNLSGSYRIEPAASPAALTDDLVPGEMETIPDPAIYASSLKFPSAVAEVGGEAWIRGQRIVRVTVSPFQYQPANGAVTFHPDIDFRLRFSAPEAAAPCTNCGFDPEMEAVLQQQLVNYEQGLAWRVPGGSEALRSQIHSPETNPFLGPRYEIVVDRDGMYRVTYADLQAAGMNVDGVDPQTFRLVNQGADVSIYVAGEGDGTFDPEDYVVFYGQKFHGDLMDSRYQATMTKPNNQFNDPAYAANNWFWQCRSGCDLTSYFERYTDENVYYLLEGGPPGPRMASVDGTPSGAPIPDHYFETVRAEEQIQWWSHEFYDDEVWFWKRIRSYTDPLQNPSTYTTTLDSLATGVLTATVHVEISARNNDPNQSPDHHSRFVLNNQLIDERDWDGRKRLAITTEIPQSALLDGTNTLTMTLSSTVLGTPDMYFDFFEITYARQFQASGGQLQFGYDQAGDWHFQVDGLPSSNIEVYDLNDPMHPVRILNPSVSGGGSSFTAGFQANTGSTSEFIVTGVPDAVLSPKKIAAYNPPDFAAMPPADVVFITHSDFMTATQALADYRAIQGHTVAVIDVQDLYHEFNDGIFHPIAIKNFLAYAFANWPSPPMYVTLVGSGNFNVKNVGDGSQPAYHNAPPSYMPPNLAYVDPWQGEVDSANLLATVIGDDTLPDVYIAHIPVKNSAEMDAVVSKVIGYETAPTADWQKNVLFIADNVPDLAGNFINLSEGIINDYIDPDPYLQPLRIYLDDGDGIPNGYDFGCTAAGTPNCKAVTHAITSTLNMTGALVVNYIGHASLNRWTGESVFVNANATSLTNGDKLPVVLSMTCLDGFWTYPHTDSLAYLFVTSAGQGAIATFSPTGLGVSTGHDSLHRGFYDSLLADGDWQLGPATTSGKLLLWATGFNYDLLHTFTIFGDPALGIQNPYAVSVTPTSDAQSVEAGTDAVYNLTVQNTGAAADSFDIQVNAGNWPAVPSTTVVGPLAPGQTAQVQVTVSVPASALDGQADLANFHAVSQGNAGKIAAAQLSTTAQTDGLSVKPPIQAMFGSAGTDLVFHLTLTNTTQLADTFTVQVSGNGWPVSAPPQVGPLAGGQSADVQVIVSIPPSALPGETDLFSVTFASQNTPSKTAQAVLQAGVSGGQIYLPLINR